MSNDVEIAKEFHRVLERVDPTGRVIAIYRQNPMMDAFFKATKKTAETGNPKYMRKARKKYTGSKV